MANRRIKSLLFGMGLGLLLLGFLLFNIVAHEAGHWAIADSFGLEPKIHLFESYSSGKISLFTPNFFTTYNSVDSDLVDATIASAGPLANMLITICLIAAYFAVPKEKRTFRVKLIFTVLLIPSIISVIANMLPIPFNDGSMIWSYLR